MKCLQKPIYFTGAAQQNQTNIPTSYPFCSKCCKKGEKGDVFSVIVCLFCSLLPSSYLYFTKVRPLSRKVGRHSLLITTGKPAHCLTEESYLDSRECLMGNLTFQEISDPLTHRRVIRLWISYPPKLFSANNDAKK